MRNSHTSPQTGAPRRNRIILASASPRRAELLRQVGIDFDVFTPEVDESQIVCSHPTETAVRRAEAKLQAAIAALELARGSAGNSSAANTAVGGGADGANDQLVLAADTMVFIGTQTFGKPKTPDEARRIVGALAGRTHTVVTACAWVVGTTRDSLFDTANVTFTPLAENELRRYVESEEWRGVAGGYRIQGLAAAFISRLEGSYATVMGLPIHRVYTILKHNNGTQ